MSLIINFNNSFKSSPDNHEMALGMYVAGTYGSNSYCYDKAARIALPTNSDKGAETAAEAPRHTLPHPG